MPAFAVVLVPYCAVRDTGLTLVTDPGNLVPSATTIPSGTNATSMGAGQDWATTGTKATQRFRVGLSYPGSSVIRTRVRAQWQIVTTSTAGAPTGRLTYRWEKNGAPISGAVTVNGSTQALNAANGTQYTDIVTVSVPTGIPFTPGDTLDLVVGFEVVVAAGTATGQVQLNHDPAVAAQRLTVEFEANN